MTGRHGPTTAPNTMVKSSVTISLSPTPSVSRTPSRRKHAMPSSSRSIKSELSLNPFKLPPMPTLQVGVSWSLIAPERQKILSLLISRLVSVLDKSRLVLLAAGTPITKGKADYSERLAKYNQLLRIEAELGDKAIYAGNK